MTSIAGSDPRPIPSNANPNDASEPPTVSLMLGRTAAHPPQNTPKTPNASTRPRALRSMVPLPLGAGFHGASCIRPAHRDGHSRIPDSDEVRVADCDDATRG